MRFARLDSVFASRLDEPICLPPLPHRKLTSEFFLSQACKLLNESRATNTTSATDSST